MEVVVEVGLAIRRGSSNWGSSSGACLLACLLALGGGDQSVAFSLPCVDGWPTGRKKKGNSSQPARAPAEPSKVTGMASLSARLIGCGLAARSPFLADLVSWRVASTVSLATVRA